MTKEANTFAIDLFDNNTMKSVLPETLFKKISHGQTTGNEQFTAEELNIFASALKDWAKSRGATKYTHWFLPLNNCSAGKRNDFSSIDCDGKRIDKFRGKELFTGEGDASSFPNGGIRQTFEAKGVTHWDYTSYAFVREGCLYIPCGFCSFGGETLDKKTPLVSSCRALDHQARKLIALFGKEPSAVYSVVGAEQEYFLIDKDLYYKREDLVVTGRTLFGAKPPKCQQLRDHYFALPPARVVAFMEEVDEQLAKLGILVKTEHNEVAPCQFELVPCYQRSTISCDQNTLIMDTLQQVAERHGLVCLLHEKPFNYVNGSGKHNNWSIVADDKNVFESGNTFNQNAIFTLFVTAVLQAVDKYQDLLRAATVSATNARRLGGMEAPTSVISVFMGSKLWDVLQDIGHGFTLGKDLLPDCPFATDRNRTSPFAFTGNKFELRMVGSSACLADVNTVLNTIVAESLHDFRKKLQSSHDFWTDLNKLIADSIAEHQNIVFNGNNYDKEWPNDAKKRNLKILSDTEAICSMTENKNIKVFADNKVFDKREIEARKDVTLENYCTAIEIESATAVDMYQKQIAPSATLYATELSKLAEKQKNLGLDVDTIVKKIKNINELTAKCDEIVEKIATLLAKNESSMDLRIEKSSCLVKSIDELRLFADKIEEVCPKRLLDYPTYQDLLLLK